MVVGPIAGRLFHLYANALRNAPVRTQMLSTGTLWAVGDLMSQRIEGKKPLDVKRTLATAVYGGAFIGPFGHYWYQGLDKFAARFFPRGGPSFIGTKVFLDTAVFGPVHIFAFFSYMIYMEGGSSQDVVTKLHKDFWPTMGAEVAFWPAFQAVNFWKVPVDYHLLVVNAATVFESTFMCWARAQDDWWGVVSGKVKSGLGKMETKLIGAAKSK